MTTSLKDFLPGYLAEADEHLSLAKENLLALEERLRAGETHPRAVRELFRSLHTMKGLSAMIGVEPVVEIAHLMEGVFRVLEREGGRLPATAIETLFAGLSAIEERVGALSAGRPIAKVSDQLLRDLSELSAERSEGTSPAALRGLAPDLVAQLSVTDLEQLRLAIHKNGRAVRIDFAPSTEQAAAGVNITSIRQRAARVGEIVKVMPTSIEPTPARPNGLVFVLLLATSATDDELAQALELPRASFSEIGLEEESQTVLYEEPERDTEDGDRLAGGFVRVSVARLDETMERLSALIVDRFKMARAVADLAARGTDVLAISTVLSENSRHLRDLRASIMKTRLVKVDELLRPLPLLVRGAAKATGKNVKLEMNVGGVELDKAVAERLFPALVHLVRNAVDHAIESPAARLEVGKPPQGTIEIVSRGLASNQLELTIRDDGRGIDRRKVAAKARRKVPLTERRPIGPHRLARALDARHRHVHQRTRHGHGHRPSHRHRRAARTAFSQDPSGPRDGVHALRAAQPQHRRRLLVELCRTTLRGAGDIGRRHRRDRREGRGDATCAGKGACAPHVAPRAKPDAAGVPIARPGDAALASSSPQSHRREPRRSKGRLRGRSLHGQHEVVVRPLGGSSGDRLRHRGKHRSR